MHATQPGQVFSERELARYRDDGYVIKERVVDAEMLGRLRAGLAEFIEGARGLTESNDVYDLEPSHRPEVPRLRRVKRPHLHSTLFDEMVRYPPMVSLLKQLLGANVRYQNSRINLKEARGGSPLEWHQDWAFYPHTNDELLAVGILLEDCRDENGPMLLIPGTHRGKIYSHHSDGLFCGAIDPDDLGDEPKRAVPFIGPAGSMSFHHVRLVHGSAENRSPSSRPLLLYTYKAADAWPLNKWDAVADLDAWNAKIVAGEPAEPRMVDLPVRMPLPLPPNNGSIYERQASAKNRFFEVTTQREM